MKIIKKYLLACLIILQTSLFVEVYAGGFQNSQTTITALARGYSGVGIAGDDLSDMFYNPAGLALSDKRSFQFGAVVIDSSTDFKNANSSILINKFNMPISGIEDNAGITSTVPVLYYGDHINNKLSYGIGLTTPFGLGTEYEDNWIGRYHSIKSKLETIDINPNLAWRLNDKFVLGFGVSAQHASVELSKAVFTGVTTPDGKSTLEADNWGFGFNIGAMFELNQQTRIGLGIRSKVRHSFSGTLDLEFPGQGKTKIDSDADLELPETAYISFFHDFGDIEILSSLRWTNWSRYDELRVNFNNVLPILIEPQQWKDSWTIGLGLNYQVNNKWIFRAGYSYDETPVSSTELRSARSPDENKHTISIGARYQYTESFNIDLAYAHTFFEDAKINSTTDLVATQPDLASSNLTGDYKAEADLFGIQFRWEW